MKKRKRGGQPGNQNARKHGFFSTDLDPEQIQEFWDIIKKERVAPELALIRAKLLSSLRRQPRNRLVLNEAATLLAKWLSARNGFDRAESRNIKKAILAVLEESAGASGPDFLQSFAVDEWLEKSESSVL